MTTLKAAKAAEVLANRKTAFDKKVRTLVGHIPARMLARDFTAAFEAGKTADEFAVEIASREPVGMALHQQKSDAVKAAAQQAATTIAWVQTQLEKHGWDINAAAPYPGTWDHDYKSKQARHNLFSSLTKDVHEGYHHYRKGEPKLVKMSESGIERFIVRAEEDAAIQYDMFICKMVQKVGPTAVHATIDGSHVWSHSILTVELKDGSKQRWKTQQIWNTSVHGLQFPQWPSRIVK